MSPQQPNEQDMFAFDDDDDLVPIIDSDDENDFYGDTSTGYGAMQSPQSPMPPQPVPSVNPAAAPIPPQPVPPVNPTAAPMVTPAPAPAPTPPAPEPEVEEKGRRRHRKPGRVVRAIKRIFILTLMALMFCGGFIAGTMWEQRAHPQMSTAAIKTQITACSDLATAKMHYNGFVHYESGEIPLINQKTFNMSYSAEVRAGVDLSQAKVDVSGHDITVILPEATIQNSKIDPESVEFYDQTWSIFNWDSKEDTKQALEQASKDLEKQVDSEDLIAEANKNAQRSIKSLLAPFMKANDGYRLTVTTEKM